MTATLKQIFSDHWYSFLETFEGKIREVVLEEVDRMLHCGDLDNGYLEFSCDNCGEIRKVGFKCRSRFCSSCGKNYVDMRAEKMVSKLARCRHRHVVMTIPSELRLDFMRDRSLLSELPRCANDVVHYCMNHRRKDNPIKVGVVAIIHTFGRDLKWNPHVHLLVSEGGMNRDDVWENIGFIPYALFRKSWQRVLLDRVEKSVGRRRFRFMKNHLHKAYPKGFYVYAAGEVTNEKAAINYVGRYTGRPAIANSRIVEYTGTHVTIKYERHEDKVEVREKLEIYEFIKRVIIHISEKHFKVIRYYGIYHIRSKQKPVLKMLNEKITEYRQQYKTWRSRIMKSFGHDPLKCTNCGSEMSLSDIYYKGFGSVLEWLEEKEHRRIESKVDQMIKISDRVLSLSQGRVEPLFI